MTWVEVVDTVVKIGLGAMISGVTAYYMANSEHYKKREERKREETKYLLKEIAFKVDEASTQLIKCASEYRKAREMPPKDHKKKLACSQQAKAFEIDAVRLIGESSTLSILSGRREIRAQIDSAECSMMKIIENLWKSSEEFSQEEGDRFACEYNLYLDKVHDLLEREYSTFVIK